MFDKNDLLNNGYVKIPQLSIKREDKIYFYNNIVNNISKTYTENNLFHREYYHKYKIDELLKPFLFDIATKDLNIVIKNSNDIYMITRVVDETNSIESYRGHFDSHIFTLVTPVHLPLSSDPDNSGQLILFPKIRKEPVNEFNNIIGKFKFKFYASKEGEASLSLNYSKPNYFDFQDSCPLLFLGRQSFHYNKPFKSIDGAKRMTMLTHFFDPSPRFGFGAINRFIRGR